MKRNSFFLVTLILIVFSCQQKKESYEENKIENAGKGDTVATKVHSTVDLPAPYATKSVQNFSDVIGWPQGKAPIAPAGFNVTKFADSLKNPRWIYIAPNGDIFIAESNTITSFLGEIKAKTTGKGKPGNTLKALTG